MDMQQFQKIAKALADPRRFAMFEQIAAEGEVGCQRMGELFPVSKATISHHMRDLTNAGLVASRKDGQCVFYHAIPGVIDAWSAELRHRVASPTAGAAVQ